MNKSAITDHVAKVNHVINWSGAKILEREGHRKTRQVKEYFFSSRVVTIWNQLPVEIFNVVTATAFAAGLRSINLSHYLLGSK